MRSFLFAPEQGTSTGTHNFASGSREIAANIQECIVTNSVRWNSASAEYTGWSRGGRRTYGFSDPVIVGELKVSLKRRGSRFQLTKTTRIGLCHERTAHREPACGVSCTFDGEIHGSRSRCSMVPSNAKQNSAVREPRGGLDSGACSISNDAHQSDVAGQPQC